METLDGNVIDFTFSIKHQISFGDAIYCSGSLFDLGQWDTAKAIKLKCYEGNLWLAKQIIPSNIDFQYKFFVSKYQLIDKKHIKWIGDKNIKLQTPDAKIFEHKPISLMSFNLRYENSNDKGQFSWIQRRDNCLNLIKQSFPCVLGVQEALQGMRKFLNEHLETKYIYIGVPRDLHKGQQCGIFVRKDRFLIIDQKYEWLSQSRKPGSVGFDASLPRYINCVVLLDLRSTNKNKIMVINLHLDHQGKIARQKGMQIVLEMFKNFKGKYKNLNDFFVMGDYNTSETDKIFKCLKQAKQFKFDSMRQICPETNKSLTFNGFMGDWKQKIGNFILNETLTIDHVFGSSQNYNPKKFSVIKVQNKILSDHFPILLQIEPKQ